MNASSMRKKYCRRGQAAVPTRPYVKLRKGNAPLHESATNATHPRLCMHRTTAVSPALAFLLPHIACARDIGLDGIKRLLGRDKKSFPIFTPKAQIGRRLGHQNLPDQFPIG